MSGDSIQEPFNRQGNHMFVGTRHWLVYPANSGVGYFLRGEANLSGLVILLNSPRTYGGIGIGTTGFMIDPDDNLTFSFLPKGLMEDNYHFEKMGVLATLVVMLAIIE